MTSSCGCIYVDGSEDEHDYELEDRDAIAESSFKCCECHRSFPPNAEYWRVSIDVYEWDRDEDKRAYLKTELYEVCPDCRSAISEFFCEATPFRAVWGYIANHVDDVKGEISSGCLLRLTPYARGRVLDLIDKEWGMQGTDDDQTEG